MTSYRPVIGVTTSQRSGWRIFPLVAFNVWMAGGRAVRWTARSDADLRGVDGVIIGGGDDISPELYGGRWASSARLDRARDTLERRIVADAFDAEKPVLGICRGSQMLNVALGGTLHRDAYDIYRDSARHRTILPRKAVQIVPGTRLAMLVGDAEMRVNALHSQAVDSLGRGLRVAARDPGGMVQAIERVRDPFAIGVQWHPEHLFYAHRQQALFRALVSAAAAAHRHRPQLARVDRDEAGRHN
ncbi:gamma-glutamyl-gamma-aminobutyrate hydrolase family protein [Roseovarius sp. SYSU LYC5161]|uniref:gamma-glutamyl-gamma-aminobutyrate hydrolase family protein n=1 Tax=Roseovarius halophilus (ex Wu et al. 2025) TaxID=3376060 RepID=UPI0028722076|nr:gamma-glutamyl-gamma-aminobutyrate hydrolase family protein [Roseovarius sp.]